MPDDEKDMNGPIRINVSKESSTDTESSTDLEKDSISSNPELGSTGSSTETSASAPDFTASEPATPPLHPELAITKPPEEKKSKRLLFIILAVVVLLGAGAGAYFYMNKDNKSAQTSGTQTPPPAPSAVTETSAPSLNTAAYAFRAKETDPYQLFWRPAAGGGDKTSVSTFAKGEFISNSDVSKNMIALATAPQNSATFKIWLSEDGGKSYKNIYSSPDSSVLLAYQVTSMKLASDGSAIIFGQLDPQGKNTVKSLDIKTLKTEDLFTGEKAGVFIYAYSPVAKQVIYSEGCYNCDGNTGSPIKLYDLTNKSTTVIASETATSSIAYQAVSADFTQILVKNSTLTAEVATFLGGREDPPYELTSITLKDKTKKLLATFGEISTKDAVPPFSTAGYMDDGITPYFALKNQIFQLASGKKTLLYESSKDLVGVYYVSQDTVITSSGDYNNFLLSNFSIKDKKLTTILNGDTKTIIFGVTKN